MNRSLSAALCVGASVLALAAPALAQSGAAPAQSPSSAGVPPRPALSPPTDATTTTSPATTDGAPNPVVSVRPDPNQVAEVIVTANKREQNLNKVGITITAIGAQELQERHVTQLSDVAAAVPGLIYSPSTANTPIFTLRGVGFNEAALGVYPAVSVYLDQAPLPFPAMASRTAFDLERIEALKGPQGTLFGENSTGGAINYIAAKPTSEPHAGGDITGARFGEVSGDLYVSGPITDTIQSRLAISGEHRDDWQKSYTRDDSLGEIGWFAGRWLTTWTPREGVRLSFNLNGWVDKSDPQALQYTVYQPDVSGVKPQLTAYPFSPTTPRAADWSIGDLRPRSDRKLAQAVVRADIDLGPVQLTSISSYDTFHQTQVTDGDGYNLDNYDLAPNNGFIDSINQEVRLSNRNANRFTWVVGGNYEFSTTQEDQTLHFTYSHVSAPANLNADELEIFQKQKIENYALFGHAEYKLTDQLTVLGGIRYTNSDNHANLCNLDGGDGRVDALFSIIHNLFSGQAQPPLTAKSCYTINAQTGIGGPHTFSELHEDNVSWQGGVNYQLDPNLLIYGTVSRGYKAGSFPVVAASTTAQYVPVTQEKVTAYEGGAKATLLDRRVQLDGAAFYYDYRNKQVRGKELDPNFGLLDLLVNVPKSDIYGAEASVTARPFRGLSIDGGVTYLHSNVKRYSGYDVLGHIEDFQGEDLPFTPDWSFTLNGDYRFENGFRGGTPFVGATVVGRTGEDAVFNGDDLTPIGDPLHPGSRVAVGRPYRIPGYATLDLRAGWEAPDGRWKIMAFAKNVTNEYYIVNVIPGADTSARFAGQPATYGVTLSFKM